MPPRPSLFIDPNTASAAAAKALKPTDPHGAACIEVISRRPVATWLGSWLTDVTKTVDDRIDAAGSALCTFVVYNIPQKDCGNFSSAHAAANEYEYSKWIAKIALGIAGRPCVVVIEPDGLSVTHCLDGAKLQARMGAIASAASVLAGAGARVFIDAGCYNWIPASTMASRLASSGIQAAIASKGGFALNVSHFETTENSHTYAAELRTLIPLAKYIVDTSRNGLGPSDVMTPDGEEPEWCNPPGRALGLAPTLVTREGGCYAYMWVKTPGSSDGSRPAGAPEAGDYWSEYAIGLVERSHLAPKS